MDAYRLQDEARASALMAADFVFTSPNDAHLDKAEYLVTCFPTADHFAAQTILELEDVGRGVFLLYEYTLGGGETYRNAEFITVQDGLVREVQVFFGGRY
ncbi:nuclear transport factor 2 family protein [Microbacteriaceae bacterium VKM Ac-2855]|nr:nuclear transport factor 2 family protein [Microbacteriaceae bacterium VKM Ac-2855]